MLLPLVSIAVHALVCVGGILRKNSATEHLWKRCLVFRRLYVPFHFWGGGYYEPTKYPKNNFLPGCASRGIMAMDFTKIWTTPDSEWGTRNVVKSGRIQQDGLKDGLH
jgi:hypothetical protein